MTDFTKILKPGDKTTLRNGLQYRCYATDGYGAFPIHGAYYRADGWTSIAHRSDGSNGDKNFDISDPCVVDLDPSIWRWLPDWVSDIAMDSNARSVQDLTWTKVSVSGTFPIE